MPRRSSWIRESTRFAIYLRDELTCVWCGRTHDEGITLTIDHIENRSTGGGNEWDNLVTACWRCNSQHVGQKTVPHPRDVRRRLARSLGRNAQADAYRIAARIVTTQAVGWVAEIKRRSLLARGEDGMTWQQVVNITKGAKYDVYVGRPGKGEDGYFGNPVELRKPCPVCGATHWTRSDTIGCFEVHARARGERDPEYRRRVAALHDKVLGCFCTPAPCHGEVLLRLAQEWEGERQTARAEAAGVYYDETIPF